MFDPLARDDHGMAFPDGKAVLTSHSDVEGLKQFLKLLVESRTRDGQLNVQCGLQMEEEGKEPHDADGVMT